jgi:membrane fusion protein, multidrug efflux system
MADSTPCEIDPNRAPRTMRPHHGKPCSLMNRLAAYVIGAAAMLALAGCHKPAAQAAPPPPLVGVVNSRRMTLPILATPTGTTSALEDVAIRARVRGFLTERNFEEGSFVKKGQLLFVIEEEPYKIALQSAKAKQAQAEATLAKVEQSKARQVAAAQVDLDKAQLLLYQIEERRSRTLLARNAASREDVDKAEADRKKYEAQVEADQANYEQAKSDYDVNIRIAKAQVDGALAAVHDADLNLSYCRMYAPFPGRIGEAKVKVGNLVGPVAAGGSDNTVLATIQQLDPMGVDVQVSSRYLDRATRLIPKGLAVRLSRPALVGEQEHPYEGKCYFIDNTIDPTTSTFLVKAKIPNPQAALLPGEYVKLRIVVDQVEDAVVVPEQAVIETPAGPVVYVVDRAGKVEIQRVNAEQTYEGLRLITRGLSAGVPVIVEGLQLVRPGIPVEAKPAVLPRPTRDESKAGAPRANPARKNADGDAKGSALKAEETARPAQAPGPDAAPEF